MIDLSKLYVIDPKSLTEFREAAAKGVRAETSFKGWHFVLSYAADRPHPWRFSARRLEPAADPNTTLDFLRGLLCPPANRRPLGPADREGWHHWGWQ